MRINYQYKIRSEPRIDYEFKKYNDLVNTTTYEAIIYEQLPKIIEDLNRIEGSRQCVIIVNKGPTHPSCLISLQYQIHSKIMYVTANFRSQSEVYGRPSDTILINHITRHIKDRIKYKINYVDILVNVGNYHHEDLTET
jgi:thymidylate synthase